ncbi:glycosyltransferase family 2 protein [Fulvivirga lutea]|uniref:Glycosyltransferase family 2 protein n=1 Tax=Fulvivirga lutea TaxID=2810512 RepID=A0A974WG23_9BACT|nr:glycosyltransferase family 2 protein [Fulvivirga lutea]QSE96377.1 glycosyltransferase family 2 protein [Fulvivirga lutea]
MKISGVVITFNEEMNIRRCLESLGKVADELVVVDSFSTDRTKEIAQEMGATFIENKFEGHIEQKNFAMASASYDWVLSLDADEELSEKLIESIQQLKNSGESGVAYKMNRLTSYCGQWIHHCGWYPDTKIRFWNRNEGKWGGENPHDSVKVNESIKVQHLKGDILHYSFHTISQHIQQIDKFTTIAAQESFKRGKKAYFLTHLMIYPFWLFFKNYFLKLGILDGYYGFIVCINGAFYKFQKYAKLFVLSRNK